MSLMGGGGVGRRPQPTLRGGGGLLLLPPPPPPLPGLNMTKFGVMVNKSVSAEWGSSVDMEQEDDRSRGDGWQSERHGQQFSTMLCSFARRWLLSNLFVPVYISKLNFKIR